MRLKLKEDPSEWQKFTLVICLALVAIFFLFYRRNWLSVDVVFWIDLFLAGVILACAFMPQYFRGFYRAGMTVSFHMGQLMGRVLLTLVFFGLITPLGLCLRLMGKDLLSLKRKPDATTYWQPAKTAQEFDRMF